MTATLIKNLSRHVGEEVEIRGWLFNKRSSGKIAFLIVRDGSGLVQGVLLKTNETAFAAAEKLTQKAPATTGDRAGWRRGGLAAMNSM